MLRFVAVVICAAVQVAAIGRGRLVSAPIQFRKFDTDVKVLQATATAEEGNLFAAPSLAHSLDNPCVRSPCKNLHIYNSDEINYLLHKAAGSSLRTPKASPGNVV